MTDRMVVLPCLAMSALLFATAGKSAAPAGVMLQVGSFPSVREAEAASSRFNTAALGGMATEVRSVDLGPRGTWYRLLVGPFADRAAADRACAALQAAAVACLIAPGEGPASGTARQGDAPERATLDGARPNCD